jgi:NEDD8-activating enzyme E1
MQLAGLEEQLRPNLEKKMVDLVEEGEELLITDKSFPTQFRYKVLWSK